MEYEVIESVDKVCYLESRVSKAGEATWTIMYRLEHVYCLSLEGDSGKEVRDMVLSQRATGGSKHNLRGLLSR